MNSKEVKDVLRPYGHTETLYYYSKVAFALKNFLKGKEIAAKNWIPKGFMPYLIKRGSKLEPLYIEEFSCIDEKFLRTRAEIEHLDKAKSKITKQQAKIWEYFLPRKLADLFYATNKEGAGKPIDRIFFDIDRSNLSSEQAQQIAFLLIKEIKADKQLSKFVKYKIFLMWTGSSFHIYLLFTKSQPAAFYGKHFQYSKKDPLASFTGRWAAGIDKKVKFAVGGGHERIVNRINIDPSQTPSGKLARCPFSLHMKSAREIDGVAIPVSEKQLQDKNLVKELKSYTPEKVLKELKSLAKLIP